MAFEHGVFFQDDGDEDDDPVGHQREEVLEDEEQVVAPRDGADEVDDRRDRDPEVARHGLPQLAQGLEIQRGGVRAGYVVGAQAQGDDDGAELAEAAQAVVAGEDERAG